MFDHAISTHVLDLRVRDSAVIFEKWRQVPARDVAGFVNRGGQNRATVLAIPNGIVRPSAKEGYSKRCACNDQDGSPLNLTSICPRQSQHLDFQFGTSDGPTPVRRWPANPVTRCEPVLPGASQKE